MSGAFINSTRTLLTNLIGSREEFNLEHRYLNSVSMGAVLISLMSTLSNIILALGIKIILVTAIGFFVYLLFYWHLRINKKYGNIKWVLVLFTFIEFSFLWIINAGSYGPTPYLYCIAFSILVLLFEKWTRIIFILIVVLNLFLLLYVELHFPHILSYYKTNADRITDILIGFIMYFLLGFLIVNYIQQNYKHEKNRAEKSDYLKSAFLANMSHEIRTPMNSIIGFSKMLDRPNLKEDKKSEYIKIINENGNYLLTVIENLIDISKLESNQLTLFSLEVKLSKLFQKVKNQTNQFLINKKKDHIKLVMEIPDHEVVIQSDFDRLLQVLMNLLTNAVIYTNEGEISFGFKEEVNTVFFYVIDSGIGIEEKYLDEIFDRFRKLDEQDGQQIFRGTGIGLSISKKIIELMGGNIWVKSQYEKGSSFYLRIPKLTPGKS